MRKFLIVAILSLFLLSACSSQQKYSEQTKPTQLISITLTDAYPGNLTNVNRVELFDGSSGERKIVADRTIIQNWLNQIKDIKLIPEKDQGVRAGDVFGITLYEGEVKKFGFLSGNVNNVYYKTNKDFVEPIRALFKEQFGRQF
ncbi:hypothetical protein QFZ77_003089 [Paenibacillus sp. V4I3]|uniref:hypothetical protein n=1 Tax=unclassified Paenibacillus TaxID=185978 RepID=UPI00278504DA|nr:MULTISPECIES: hypothetical protein [unclassified Paenibacillus]MDQ0874430.1 hypothetical protein [Paenibacillus sp. V4I3]MDQ0889858.1 hypothetical protein [Paenibacillus sp. V4I9]